VDIVVRAPDQGVADHATFRNACSLKDHLGPRVLDSTRVDLDAATEATLANSAHFSR